MELKLDPASTALLVVDMQNDFCHPDGYYAQASGELSPLGIDPGLVQKSIGPMRSLLDAARQAGLFVVHTQIIREPDVDQHYVVHDVVPSTFRAISGIERPPALIGGTWGAKTHENLEPVSQEYVVEKRSFSSFYGTDLEIVLRRRGIRTVVIAGTVTYACVLHTAFDANVRDFDVIVSTDGSATWKADLQEPALKIVELILGQTASIGELIEALAIADATRIEEVIR